MELLTVSGIGFQEQGKWALQDIRFTQKRHQKIALSGETGAGKSTLLQIIAGLIQPSVGEVHFEGRRVKGPAEVLVPGQAGVAYLSQHFELPKFLRVEQVLRYANKRSAQEAQTLYDVCRINHLASRQTNQLSGGERQRIALARLLLGAPQLLLLDEPFSNLDRVHKLILQSVIQDVGERLGITCMLVSHDPLDALSWADEVLVLQAGKLVQRGTPQTIYRQPANEYVAGLFGDYNAVSGAALGALASSSKGLPTDNTLIIRPEDFTIGSSKSKGVRGLIKAAQFFGSYYELKVAVADATLTIRTGKSNFAPGDVVYVTAAAERTWLIKP
ncbi:ABC transporter ATP-binding protein [Hymenobacter sp. BT491]|uniref:ABC transporter ATP-binding protein n=1 Tax=Hymenobacter sp. BT491 TaxID=2766779 RepID=UPI001653B782|nr:ABC transporter ATP-binding protein [Hymenobacter sp. BT491]MBC6989050.1 ABC transporter ATP-binding protein [Hymenobacter sp. BT491]